MLSNTPTPVSALPISVVPGETLTSELYVEQTMPRVLTTFDLILMFVLILYFVTNDGNAAAGGPAGLTLWVIGGLFFFLPCGIATMQLGAIYPFDGGIYNWTNWTFGRGSGFLCRICRVGAWPTPHIGDGRASGSMSSRD